MKKLYLGDSVYAEFDGFGILLTTENGYPDDPQNKIYLEPGVLDALDNYRNYLKKLAEKE
jgi:hypothetical protein